MPAYSQIKAASKDDDQGGPDIFSMAAPQEMLVDANAEWQCAMCASINKAESEQCGACTYSKAKSVQSFLNLQEEKAQIAAALAESQKDAIKQVIKEDEEQKNDDSVKVELKESSKDNAENEEDKNEKDVNDKSDIDKIEEPKK